MSGEADDRTGSDEGDQRRRSSRLRRVHVRLSEEERRAALAELFLEGPELLPYIRRLAVLMALSVTIATFGILGDSPAVVIGAMLVAPLMTPITALSAALVMGWPGRQGTQLGIVAGASAGAVALAWFLARFVPQERLAELPNELVSRTEPGVLDLGIAIAAGAAAAYVTIRPQAGAAALPGVAIAVALVPPLAALGIALEHGTGAMASGALLLFLTNLAAIVFTAAVVFLVMGFHATFRPARLTRRIRTGLLMALVAVIAVAYPLGRQSSDALAEARDAEAVARAVNDWLGDRNLAVEQTDVQRRSPRTEVVVDLIGASTPAAAASLAELLTAALGSPVDLTLRITAREEIRVLPPGSGPGG